VTPTPDEYPITVLPDPFVKLLNESSPNTVLYELPVDTELVTSVVGGVPIKILYPSLPDGAILDNVKDLFVANPTVEIFKDPVTPKLPVINADPVNGKDEPPPAFNAKDAVNAYEAEAAF
jgi:hypothetical protein